MTEIYLVCTSKSKGEAPRRANGHVSARTCIRSILLLNPDCSNLLSTGKSSRHDSSQSGVEHGNLVWRWWCCYSTLLATQMSDPQACGLGGPQKLILFKHAPHTSMHRIVYLCHFYGRILRGRLQTSKRRRQLPTAPESSLTRLELQPLRSPAR